MPTILIVEDETALSRVLREAFELKLPNTQVATAVGWEDALQAVEGFPDGLDLLLTDQHLAVHTGLDLHVHLRNRYPTLRTIIYTGKATPAVESAAVQAGARVVWKPQRLNVLINLVRQELDLTEHGSARH